MIYYGLCIVIHSYYLYFICTVHEFCAILLPRLGLEETTSCTSLHLCSLSYGIVKESVISLLNCYMQLPC